MRYAVILAALLLGCEEEVDPLPPADAGKDGGVDGGPPDAARDAGGEDVPPVDTGACNFNRDCAACRADGECCEFSINCLAGSICNFMSDQFYDPTQPEAICVRVVCDDDSDCTNGRLCTLERVCRDPICQDDSDCPPDAVCLAGSCSAPPAPSDVASCEVYGSEVLRSGGTIALEAIARDASGAILPGLEPVWMSSAAARVSVAGQVATGGLEAGLAVLTASFGSVACSGQIDVINFLPVAADQVRAIAVVHGTGRPIEGVSITVDAITAITGADGSAVVTAPSPIGAISAIAGGFASISILSPGARDLVIPMPPIDPTLAGGFRGVVDTSASRRGDIPIALVGESLSADILSLGRTPLTGRDAILTVIDAPELGLEMEIFNFTGGFIFSLGTKQFMNTPERCQGMPVAERQVGCFLVRADEGHGAAWTLAGEVRLSEVTAIANELSGLLGSGDPTAGREVIELWMPVMRKLRHGTQASLFAEVHPRVSRAGADCSDPSLPNYFAECAPDFSRYQPIGIEAVEPQHVGTIVSVPNLPQVGSECAEAATVFGAVYLGRRGLVPLGFGAANDVADMEPPDCVVSGAEQRFGDNSPELFDGQIALATAPKHAGLEGHGLALISIARLSTPGAQAPFFRSVTIDRVGSFEESAVAREWLGPPTGSIDAANASVTFDAAGGTFVRAELYGAGNAWLVYAPGTETTLTLPDVAARAVLSDLQNAILLRAEANVGFGAVFELGANARADRSFEIIDRFAVQEAL